MVPPVPEPSQNPTSGEARLWSRMASPCTEWAPLTSSRSNGHPRTSRCGTGRYDMLALHVHHLDGPPLGARRAISTITSVGASP